MSYNEFRHFADSWGLVFMGVTYLALVGWAILDDEQGPARERDNG